MAIDNDFLEFFNTEKCKKILMLITIFVFFSLSVTEIISRPSAFLREISLLIFVFWSGRASKKADSR